MWGSFSHVVFVVLLSTATTAIAEGSYAEFLLALAQRESGDRSNPSGNPFSVNAYGYVGLYQMGEAAMIDAGYYKPDGTARNDWTGTWTGKNGVNSLTDFLGDPSKQNQAITDYHQKLAGYVRSFGLDSYVGKTVSGVLITESGMIAGAHLVGIGGLQTYLASGGKTIPKDANGTPITEYLTMFGGYSISSIAPAFTGTPPASGSGSSIPSATIPVPASAIPIPSRPA